MSKDRPADDPKAAIRPDEPLGGHGASAVLPAKLESDQSQDDTQEKAVPYFSLYRGLDGKDCVAISFGLLGAFVNGLTQPGFSFVFAEVRPQIPAHVAVPTHLTACNVLASRTATCSRSRRLRARLARWQLGNCYEQILAKKSQQELI